MSKTVEIPYRDDLAPLAQTREILIEALAAIDAAGDMLIAQTGARTETPVSDFFSQKAWELKYRAFGPGLTGEGYLSDPVSVEIYARSHELTAEALDNIVSVDDVASRFKRAAEQIRKAGSIDAVTAFGDDEPESSDA